ncbi:MAG: nuclear transport factor 2 family protein, partial [Bacteroidota bacterium]
MKIHILFLTLISILSFFVISCNNENPSPMLTQAEKVTSFLEAVNKRDVAKIEELVAEDYIQHNPFIPTGRAPFTDLLTTVLADNGTKVSNVRIIEEDTFVAIHNLWTNAEPFGADTVVTFDILRFDENGKIAEHWDAIQPWASQTVNGNTMVDGPTNITDLDQTEANKALAVSIIEDVYCLACPRLDSIPMLCTFS